MVQEPHKVESLFYSESLDFSGKFVEDTVGVESLVYKMRPVTPGTLVCTQKPGMPLKLGLITSLTHIVRALDQKCSRTKFSSCKFSFSIDFKQSIFAIDDLPLLTFSVQRT